jgi:hypothetical protein
MRTPVPTMYRQYLLAVEHVITLNAIHDARACNMAVRLSSPEWQAPNALKLSEASKAKSRC